MEEIVVGPPGGKAGASGNMSCLLATQRPWVISDSAPWGQYSWRTTLLRVAENIPGVVCPPIMPSENECVVELQNHEWKGKGRALEALLAGLTRG